MWYNLRHINEAFCPRKYANEVFGCIPHVRGASFRFVRRAERGESVNVIETAIPGVKILEPDIYRDGRGYFVETYNAVRYR